MVEDGEEDFESLMQAMETMTGGWTESEGQLHGSGSLDVRTATRGG